MKILVTGAGGFIGHHLVKELTKIRGYDEITGVDLKEPEFEKTSADHFIKLDLRNREEVDRFFRDREFHEVYALAADMGGMGYIADSQGHAHEIIRNNLLINLNTIDTAAKYGVDKLLFTSSACVYPMHLQLQKDIIPLKESDAYPAFPEDAYGWEKLVTERLCQYFSMETRMDTRVVRFHNIYGPMGTWRGGREKSPAALCRKIAHAKLTETPFIELWGDGEQTRSFCYIDDCVDGILRLMASDYDQPLNLGSDRMVSINELAKIIMDVAGYRCEIQHVDGPQGVRGRNSDNTRLREVLGWEPPTRLEVGLSNTYGWIEAQVAGTLETK